MLLVSVLLILSKMKLVISKGKHATIWQVLGSNIATRLQFPNFTEQDIFGETLDLQPTSLPIEIVDLILKQLFQFYLETFNFDLCQDLLLFSKSFTRSLYREIYGQDKSTFYTTYHRLLNTFHILENIYDDYLTESALEAHTCIKLISAKPINSNHRPWHFTNRPIIGQIRGLVIDLTEDFEYACVGPHYGNYVYIQGRYQNGFFNAGHIKTPVLNLVFVDLFDTLIPSYAKIHQSYLGFFELLKRAFGRHTGVFVMMQQMEEMNPFVTQSDLFLEF
jgi:hypothetical protein